MGDVSYLPLIEDMTWSYSRVETFDDCPYRFFLKYIHGSNEQDKFYATYGSLMHELIEEYYNEGISNDELCERFLLRFPEQVIGERPGPDIAGRYVRSGIEYLRNVKPMKYHTIGVEKRVEFEINGYNFLGFIDYLGELDGEYYIVDNKSRDLKPRSNRKTPTVKDKELDKMLRQLYLYSAAVKQEYGKFPKSLCFNCFRTGVFIEEPFKIEDYESAISWATESIEYIKESDDFPPSIDFFACRYICGVSDDCVYDQITREGRRRGVK